METRALTEESANGVSIVIAEQENSPAPNPGFLSTFRAAVRKNKSLIVSVYVVIVLLMLLRLLIQVWSRDEETHIFMEKAENNFD